MGVGKGNVQVVNVYFLAVFQLPWGQGSRGQRGTNRTLGPRGGFPYKLNFPQHRTEREGVGSSTVATAEIFEPCTPVAHMLLRGRISCGGGGMGCRNCLKRLVARMSLYLHLAPAVPAGSRVARKYDPLLLRGNVGFAPIMYVPDASDTSRKCELRTW